jgi:hypothetical protein
MVLADWALNQNFGTVYPKNEAAYSEIMSRLSVVRSAAALRTKLQKMTTNGRRSGLFASLRLVTASRLEYYTAAEAAAVGKERKSAAKSGGRGSHLNRKPAPVEQPDFQISVVFKDARKTLKL